MIYVLAANGLPWYHYLYSIPLILISIFLMLVILVQRGRGGGLTGALGGMGGQSAFGTKAGDLFTRITIVVAAIWVLLAMVTIQRLSRPRIAGRNAAPATTKEKEPATKKGADQSKGESPAAGTSKGAESQESKPSGAGEPAKGTSAEPSTGATPAGDEGVRETGGEQAPSKGDAKSSEGK